MQIQGLDILLLVQVNSRYKGHTEDHTGYRGSEHLLSYTRQIVALLGALLEAIKGGAQGFNQGRRTLHSFSPP
jgi:hypothetical protein